MSADALPAAARGAGKAPLAYALAALVIALDQVSKWWVLGPLALPTRGQVPVLPPILNLTLVHNAGVSFGLLRADADLARWALVAFSTVVALALAVWARTAARAWTATALGLVIGGALGNVVDRVRLGWVTDFIDVSGTRVFPWVFNVADSAITVGVILLLAESLFAPKKP